jgi:hypothetical protein
MRLFLAEVWRASVSARTMNQSVVKPLSGKETMEELLKAKTGSRIAGAYKKTIKMTM